MSDRREASARSPDAANGRTPSGPGSDRERVLLLECRLEQMRAALATARDDADQVREQLAVVAARETEHARRYCLIHEELAEARAEIAVLHRHLERSEALRAEIAGHLFEGDVGEDREELLRLRRKALAEDQRAMVSDRSLARLRARVEELVASRETLLTRVAEWQQLIRRDGPEAADLSEFLAELRREILDLERRGATSDAREAKLRERLALAGIDPEHDAQAAVVPKPGDAPEADETEEQEATAANEADPSPPAKVSAPADTSDPADTNATAETGDPAGTSVPAEAGPPVEASASGLEAAVASEDEAGVASGDEARDDLPDEPEPELELEDQVAASDDPGAPAVSYEDRVVPAAAASTSSRTDALVAELLDAQLPELRADLLLRLGRTGDTGAADTIRPWTKSSEPSVRAAAYEALGRLLEREPMELAPHLERGLLDGDARVRRRVVLATATARGLEQHGLLEPLRDDSDPQVRRLVRQVLRQAPSAGSPPEASPEPSVPKTSSRV
ncbi:MAG: HEAT repeat domain-containing protein [Gemmatimonadota bacterium]